MQIALLKQQVSFVNNAVANSDYAATVNYNSKEVPQILLPSNIKSSLNGEYGLN